MTIRFATSLTCGQRISRIISVFALAFTGSLAFASANTTGSYRIDALRWMHGYVDYFVAHDLEVKPEFNAPAIWLFSPDGAMTQLVSSNDDPELEKFRAGFPFDVHSKQLAGMPSLKQMNEMLSTVLGTQVTMGQDHNAWSAVLFLSDSPDCKHCASYDKEVSELEQHASSQLKVVRVTAMF